MRNIVEFLTLMEQTLSPEGMFIAVGAFLLLLGMLAFWAFMALYDKHVAGKDDDVPSEFGFGATDCGAVEAAVKDKDK